jgi:hypothetical protein
MLSVWPYSRSKTGSENLDQEEGEKQKQMDYNKETDELQTLYLNKGSYYLQNDCRWQYATIS